MGNAKYTYKTKGTCSTAIHFDINGNVISNVSFENGCNGNLQAVSRLVDGMTVEAIKEKCKGINCASKGTSCADQLALAVEKAYKESHK